LAPWEKAENLREDLMGIIPKPDRSTFQPNPRESDQNPELDIGWGEGGLSDGRPYRLELWAKDQESFLTFFFSIIGLEEMSEDDFPDFLVKEGLIKLIGQKSAGAVRIIDSSQKEMWSVTVRLKDKNGTYAVFGPLLKEWNLYPRQEAKGALPKSQGP
jgi:hypothetical protein